MKEAKFAAGETAPRPPGKIRYARAKFGDVVLVCTKCAKRQGLPKGAMRATLKRALKERAGPSKGQVLKPRLVEVGCLGPCPKRAVAVATTASLARGRIALIDPTGDRQAILDALLPDFGPKAALRPSGALEDPGSGPRTS
ncbi:(2Fe-2S) ferredoxin domain-containing protein [Methylobacterium sp. J-090]|uniref:(2Fe-2S) ferredoxin domain-containing protein n=1 Tax=Methylobacterium sp. J-090 TaxID=2836666 RepID=UPI001FB8F414|nr:(2Fe-2S) ferredoxin domain-containing protein [Methylobacterium sp. J-090]MCJ2080993.1 (2Fe-2S) ferredoxin domain-containing protein [Methylobacterium sp. J-090]